MEKQPRSLSVTGSAGSHPKIMMQEARHLTNAELIAMIIGPGSARYNCSELATQVLSSARNRLSELTKMTVRDLMRIPGIGRAKANALYAFAELSRRRQAEEGLEKLNIRGTQSAEAFVRPLLKDLNCEEFGVLFLNQVNKVITFEIISKGGITATFVDPRIIFKKAIELNAVSIIVAHNHPSGNSNPSRADDILTNRICEGAKYLDIKFLDHIIVAENGYYSYLAEGRLS